MTYTLCIGHKNLIREFNKMNEEISTMSYRELMALEGSLWDNLSEKNQIIIEQIIDMVSNLEDLETLILIKCDETNYIEINEYLSVWREIERIKRNQNKII